MTILWEQKYTLVSQNATVICCNDDVTWGILVMAAWPEMYRVFWRYLGYPGDGRLAGDVQGVLNGGREHTSLSRARKLLQDRILYRLPRQRFGIYWYYIKPVLSCHQSEY